MVRKGEAEEKRPVIRPSASESEGIAFESEQCSGTVEGLEGIAAGRRATGNNALAGTVR